MRARLCFGLACCWIVVSCAGDAGRADRGLKKNVRVEAAGAAPPGYGAAVARAHEQLTNATPADLARRAPKFQTPAAPNLSKVQYLDLILKPVSHGQKSPQLALHQDERAKLIQNRFVSSERLGSTSYAALYHRIYEHDQPVFITADSVLHAFHKSYDAMLEQLEREIVIKEVDIVLSGMARRIRAAATVHESDALHQAVLDADVFVAVGRSLLGGKDVPPVIEESHGRVRDLVAAIGELDRHRIKLFGFERIEDFSQMKPRGHYTNSVELEQYFRAMMWLGRTELRVAGSSVPTDELAGAIVLHELLVRSAELPRWQRIDKLIQTCVGPADAMNVTQLDQVLKTRTTSGAIQEPELQALQALIARASLGAQEINSQLREPSPEGPGPMALPNAFAFFPQRFTVDSWVLSQLVFDRARFKGAPIEREIPSGVDVAFSAFGNDSAAALLARRIESKNGMPFRDGLPIQASLLATRTVVDARPSEAWTSNLYEAWLNALRGLSEPTVDARYPSVMRSEAWANRRMQTQLASWAELRHDTILYAKQSYGGVTCEYPAGFVELQPLFWERLGQATKLAEHALDDTQLASEQQWLKDAQAAHWKSFGETVATLHRIATKELESRELTADETKFLKEAVEVIEGGGCGGPPIWSGWFPKLYYGGTDDATEWSALVADVHTSPQRGVLSVATGGVDLTIAIIERGEHTMAFAGPTAQYWESMGGVRMNDNEWKEKLAAGQAPPRPEWTDAWLVPGAAPYLSHAR
jgi:hypothetical protein